MLDQPLSTPTCKLQAWSTTTSLAASGIKSSAHKSFNQLLLYTICALIGICTTGCSAFKGVIFDNVDWLIANEIDEYLDLDDAAYKDLERRLKPQLHWAQQSLIPEVITEIDRLISYERKFSEQEITAVVRGKTLALWYKILDQVAPDAGYILANLDTKQLQHLAEVLRDKNQRQTAMINAKPDDFQEAYAEQQQRRLERLEEFVGTFSEHQKSQYFQQTRRSQEDVRKEQLLRQEVRDGFIIALKIKRTPEEMASFIKDWARLPKIQNPERYQKYREERWQRRIKSMVLVENLLTPAQLKFRRQKLREVRADLVKLSQVDLGWKPFKR